MAANRLTETMELTQEAFLCATYTTEPIVTSLTWQLTRTTGAMVMA